MIMLSELPNDNWVNSMKTSPSGQVIHITTYTHLATGTGELPPTTGYTLMRTADDVGTWKQ